MDAAAFQRRFNVPRGTMDRLETFASLLQKWQKAINLVGSSTLPDLWNRHFADSAQLLPHIADPQSRIADLGSGAGFPGLVLAILGAGNVHLVESDSRKCAFLREVAGHTKTPVTVHTERIENLAPLAAGCVVARALAPLEKLLPLAFRHGGPQAEYFFLKGAGARSELTAVANSWKMKTTNLPSLTDPSGVIVKVTELHHA